MQRISPCLLRSSLSLSLCVSIPPSFREKEREREGEIERFGGAVERRCSLARSFAVTRQTLIEANWTPRGSRRSIKFPLDDPFYPYRAFSASLIRIRLCGYSIERRFRYAVTIGCLRFTRRAVVRRGSRNLLAIKEQKQSVSPWACQKLNLLNFIRQLIFNSVTKENFRIVLYEWRTDILRDISLVCSKKWN